MKPADLLAPELSTVEQDAEILLERDAELERAAQVLDLEAGIVQRLKHPEREITLNLQLQESTCTAFRVQHSSAPGPCLGPVLASPEAHLPMLRALALQLSLQCALSRLPLGGAAGALVCDSEQLTEPELHGLVRQYVFGLRTLIGPALDVLAPPDFAAAWAWQAYSEQRGQAELAAIVNKPAALGGTPDAPAAIAAGWQALIETCLEAHQRELKDCRVALQGFGRCCGELARRLHEAGARVVGVADKSGGLWRETGIDVASLQAHVRREGMLFGFPEADAVRNSEVLESECDLLMVAAAPRQINLVNAANIRAPLVIEAAHQAITPQAGSVLQQREIEVVPELLGVAPQTLAWFAEWQHGIRYAVPEQAEIESFVRTATAKAFRRTRAHSAEHRVPLRVAALALAMDALATVLRLRA